MESKNDKQRGIYLKSLTTIQKAFRVFQSLSKVVISYIIYSCFGLAGSGNPGYGTAVVLGIMLLLASPVFRYSAELEENVKETSEQTNAER